VLFSRIAKKSAGIGNTGEAQSADAPPPSWPGAEAVPLAVERCATADVTPRPAPIASSTQAALTTLPRTRAVPSHLGAAAPFRRTQPLGVRGSSPCAPTGLPGGKSVLRTYLSARGTALLCPAKRARLLPGAACAAQVIGGWQRG
jgi:hypothetical protein